MLALTVRHNSAVFLGMHVHQLKPSKPHQFRCRYDLQILMPRDDFQCHIRHRGHAHRKESSEEIAEIHLKATNVDSDVRRIHPNRLF